jgi:hypothetical protein
MGDTSNTSQVYPFFKEQKRDSPAFVLWCGEMHFNGMFGWVASDYNLIDHFGVNDPEPTLCAFAIPPLLP